MVENRVERALNKLMKSCAVSKNERLSENKKKNEGSH